MTTPRFAPQFAVVEAPSTLGLRPTGVELLPEALLRADLAEKLNARHAGRVEPPPYDTLRDPETMMLNPIGIRDYAIGLADLVGGVLDRGEFPVVLGGDCSILLGNLLALRRRGRYGLLFMDGHADFYQPEAEPTGEAASMDLALATGRGPAIVTDLEGRRPLMRDEDAVLFGQRDAEMAEQYGSQPVPERLRTIDLAEIRRVGAEAAATRAVTHLMRDELAGLWLHLDVDLLDDAIMPAVDYRMPDGLTWDELASVLCTAVASGRASGIEVTIFNPRLDRGGQIAEALTQTLVDGLAS